MHKYPCDPPPQRTHNKHVQLDMRGSLLLFYGGQRGRRSVLSLFNLLIKELCVREKSRFLSSFSAHTLRLNRIREVKTRTSGARKRDPPPSLFPPNDFHLLLYLFRGFWLPPFRGHLFQYRPSTKSSVIRNDFAGMSQNEQINDFLEKELLTTPSL